jgi:hypothetical protein
VRKLPFPAWYLPKGTINATEGDLEEGSSSCERWGLCCGTLVVIAVIAELVIAWIEPPYKTFLAESAITDAAIALGIVGEVMFGMLDGRIQTELRRRSNDMVAEANTIAAQAIKEAAEARERTAEVEKLTAWRRIKPEQYSSIIKAIRDGAAEIDLLVEYERGDAEAFSYARQIAWAFEQAGVTKIRGDANSYWAPGIFGVRIASEPAIDILSIMDAFSAAGIEPVTDNMDLSRHLPRNVPAPNLYFFVAPKTPPDFGLPMHPVR